jgi:hypothetical protein
MRNKCQMIRLSDEQWERIRHHFPEEHIPDGRPGRKPIPALRWSRHIDPIAAGAPRKMDADFGDMPRAGWSNGSSPGFNGSATFLSVGSFIRRTSSASCNSPASSSSSNDFEIGSTH